MKPILFKPHMVTSIFDDIKSQTRRIIKQEPVVSEDGHVYFQQRGANRRIDGHNWKQYFIDNFCPFGKIGDLLWVRETHFLNGDEYIYRADGECCDQFEQCECNEIGKPAWKPSIHMPKVACRLFLKITDIRIERLQEISYTDAAAEGVEKLVEGYRNYFSKLNPPGETFFWPNAYHSFQSLWESIHGSESWEANPWLWVIEFEKTDKPASWPQ